MKHTVQEVAKKTGLAASTVQKYAWAKNLGTLEGRKKFFTAAEVKQLSALKDGSGRAATAGKSVRSKRATKPQAKRAVPPVVKKEAPKVEPKTTPAEQTSFWSFLRLGPKPKAKVGLMDAGIGK